MLTASAIVPVVSLLKWPATIVGAILVFGLSTDGTLSLVSSNIHKFTPPVQAAPSFSLPPVKQIGELTPRKIEHQAPAEQAAASAAPAPSATMDVALRQPLGPATDALDDAVPTDLRPGSIGSWAVNVRAAPSKTSAKVGLLSAGAPIRLGEQEGGWVHVWYEGGDGWVYSTYIAGAQQPTMTSDLSVPEKQVRPARKGTIESGGRIVAREDPDSDAQSLFRLEPGERVKVLEQRGRWVKVATADGLTGWIRTK